MQPTQVVPNLKKKFIMLVFLFVLGLFSIDQIAIAQVLAPEKSIVYLTDKKGNELGSGFFVGDGGYILTVIKEESINVSDTVNVYFYHSPSPESVDRINRKAVVIDIQQNHRLAIVQLSGFDQSNVSSLKSYIMVIPKNLKGSTPLKIFYANSQNTFSANCSIYLTGTSNGAININALQPKFSPKMLGAPVFADNNLVGILADSESVIPINHAASLLAMAEGAIMGAATVRKLIDEHVQEKNEWKELIHLLEDKDMFRQMKELVWKMKFQPKVIPKILAQADDEAGIQHYFEAEIEKPLEIEHEVSSILAKGYPIWSYPRKFESGKASEYRTLSGKYTQKYMKGIQFEFSYLQGKPNQSMKKLIPIAQLRNSLAHAVGAEDRLDFVKIKGLRVEFGWVVKGPSLDGETEYKKTHASTVDLLLEK